MILNDTMIDALHTIRRIEGAKISKSLDVCVNDLGNRLIDVYYFSSNLTTRELITDFMTQAGNVWLRKLLTRDTGPVESSVGHFASMDEYVGLLAANDASLEYGLAG